MACQHCLEMRQKLLGLFGLGRRPVAVVKADVADYEATGSARAKALSMAWLQMADLEAEGSYTARDIAQAGSNMIVIALSTACRDGKTASEALREFEDKTRANLMRHYGGGDGERVRVLGGSLEHPYVHG